MHNVNFFLCNSAGGMDVPGLLHLPRLVMLRTPAGISWDLKACYTHLLLLIETHWDTERKKKQNTSTNVHMNGRKWRTGRNICNLHMNKSEESERAVVLLLKNTAIGIQSFKLKAPCSFLPLFSWDFFQSFSVNLICFTFGFIKPAVPKFPNDSRL